MRGEKHSKDKDMMITNVNWIFICFFAVLFFFYLWDLRSSYLKFFNIVNFLNKIILYFYSCRYQFKTLRFGRHISVFFFLFFLSFGAGEDFHENNIHLAWRRSERRAVASKVKRNIM